MVYEFQPECSGICGGAYSLIGHDGANGKYFGQTSCLSGSTFLDEGVWRCSPDSTIVLKTPLLARQDSQPFSRGSYSRSASEDGDGSTVPPLADVGTIIGIVSGAIGGLAFLITMGCVIWGFCSFNRRLRRLRGGPQPDPKRKSFFTKTKTNALNARVASSPNVSSSTSPKADSVSSPLLASSSSNIVDTDAMELRLLAQREEADRGLAEIRAKRAAMGGDEVSYDVPPAYHEA